MKRTPLLAFSSSFAMSTSFTLPFLTAKTSCSRSCAEDGRFGTLNTSSLWSDSFGTVPASLCDALRLRGAPVETFGIRSMTSRARSSTESTSTAPDLDLALPAVLLDTLFCLLNPFPSARSLDEKSGSSRRRFLPKKVGGGTRGDGSSGRGTLCAGDGEGAGSIRAARSWRTGAGKSPKDDFGLEPDGLGGVETLAEGNWPYTK